MKIIFSLALIINIMAAQPDSRFEAFDWTLYRQTGNINSISEGYDYIYFATENAGILRFKLYQNKFDDPITTAQGLSNNKILAIHFDQDTGILWSASDKSIDYSYNAEGNWFNIDLSETGLHRKARIQQIGSSINYIWINAGSTFLKLDKVSGIVIGLLPIPDEEGVTWSSKRELYLEIPNTLKNYTILDGWIMNYNQFIDPFGKIIEPTTFYFGKNSKVYIGMEDGTIFTGAVQMETFYPFHFGLNNTDITAFSKHDDYWIVGQNNSNAEGITKYNFRKNEFQHYDFENSINLSSQPFYSILETDKEVWFGGSSVISIYNKKKDYWREINEANGLPNGRITSLAEDSTSIWVGTIIGLAKVSKINKHTEHIDIERLLRTRNINDIEIIGDNLWIATENYLLIYDQKNHSLIDFKSYGNIDNIKERKNIFTKFTNIVEDDDGIYISTPVGILKYSIYEEQWKVVVEPSVYNSSKVNNLTILNGVCFIGVDNGIWQVDIKNGHSQLYNYPFIGSVKDMYIHGDILLIGSDNGLVKYLWKKNL